MAQKRYGYQYGGKVYLGGDEPAPRLTRGGTQPPDAASNLNILRRGQQRPWTEDDELAEMIPEEDLFEAQNAYNERGREAGGAYYIPSREQLRSTGVSRLRQFLGMKQAEAQAQALPSQVAGEYGLREQEMRGRTALEQERLRGQSAVEAAKIRAQETGALQRMLEGGRNERAELSAETRGTLQQNAMAERQARDLEAHPERATIPEATGPIEWVQRNTPLGWIFGRGRFDPETVAREQASQLRSRALSNPMAQRAAQRIRAENPDLSLQQLQAFIMEEFDPEEAQQVIAALVGGR